MEFDLFLNCTGVILGRKVEDLLDLEVLFQYTSYWILCIGDCLSSVPAQMFPVLWCPARLSRVLGCNDNTATSTRFPSYSQNHSDFGICQTNHKNMDQESGVVISASSVGEIPPGILQLVKMSPCLESLGRLRGRGNTRELETHLE